LWLLLTTKSILFSSFTEILSQWFFSLHNGYLTDACLLQTQSTTSILPSSQHHQIHLPLLYRHLLYPHGIAQSVIVACGGFRDGHRILVKAVEIVRQVAEEERAFKNLAVSEPDGKDFGKCHLDVLQFL